MDAETYSTLQEMARGINEAGSVNDYAADMSALAGKLYHDAAEAHAEVERLTRELKAAQSKAADMARFAPQRGEVKALREEVRVLREQRRRVLVLHRREIEHSQSDGDRGVCVEDYEYWPCATVRALGVAE